MLKYVKGDLVDLAHKGVFDVIMHGCNCFCNMGAGIAKDIKKMFPAAYKVDCDTVIGDRDKLGTCSVAYFDKVHVVNAYTQYHYGRKKARDGINLDYIALEKCLIFLKENYSGLEIGLPQIGCGLAGGDWNKVESLINKVLGDEDVTVVIYDN